MVATHKKNVEEAIKQAAPKPKINKDPDFYIPKDFAGLLAEIDATARAQGEWDGRMLSCYVACQEAYKAGIVNVPHPSERMRLGEKLAALMKAANELYNAKTNG